MAMTTIADVLEDPAASHWLKHALRTALARDCVDVAEEAAVLAELLGARVDSILASHIAQAVASQSLEGSNV